MNFDADEWDRSRRRSETLERAQAERQARINAEMLAKAERDNQAAVAAERARAAAEADRLKAETAARVQEGPMKTFEASIAITTIEKWKIEAESIEEARERFNVMMKYADNTREEIVDIKLRAIYDGMFYY